MLRLKSHITISQKTSWNDKTRSEIIDFEFVREISIESSWQNLTDRCKISFPKNIYVELSNGKIFPLKSVNITEGNDTPPIFMRGDEVKIELGYIWFDGIEDQTEMVTEFEGYINAINNDISIELDCEDDMWLLKQISTPNKTFSQSQGYTVGKMLREILEGKGFDIAVRDKVSAEIGDFICVNTESVAKMLDRLKKDYHLYTYIRRINTASGVKKELRCAAIAYYPEDQKDVFNDRARDREWIFDFNQNIISSELKYFRKEDLNVHIKAISKVTEVTGTTRSNKQKTKKKDVIIYVPDDKILDCELKTYHYLNTTEAKMRVLATKQLNRMSYTGWRGSFTTFGMPSARHGDLCYLQSRAMPERNGQFLVKSLKKTFGVNGYRQVIELDMQTDINTQQVTEEGL